MIPESCPVCTAADVPFEATDVRVGDAGVFTCKTCDALFLHPPGHVEYTDSGWTDMRQRQWEDDTARAKRLAPRILEEARSRLGRPVQRVLEVGCGSAFMGLGFEDAGATYVGLDVDEGSIGWAREQGIDARLAPAESLHTWAAEEAPFDLLISSNCYEHVQDPNAAFAALAASGVGLIAIIVPNPDGLIASVKANPVLRRVASRVTGNRQTAYSLDGTWHNIAYRQSTLRVLCARHHLDVLELDSMAVNDPIWGFVQPQRSAVYRAAASVEALAQRQTLNFLLARPPARAQVEMD